jgi:hypothetical protein
VIGGSGLVGLPAPGERQAGARTRIEDAVTVKMHGGVVQTSEGPFVSPSNAVTDRYEVEVDSLEAAIDTAARIPHLAYGSVVEIRRLQNVRHSSAPRRRVDR